MTESFRNTGFGSIFTQATQASSPGHKNKFIESDRNTMSVLTQGAGTAFSGNPLKAMRFKRKKQFVECERGNDGEEVIKAKGILELVEEFKKY